MLGNQGQASGVTVLLAPINATNTAEATGAWTDVRFKEGDLDIIVSVGVVTAGSVAIVIQDATDDQGAGAATKTPNEGAWTTVTTANDPMIQKRTINGKATRGYIRVLGTVTTGPVAISASLQAHPKYT